MKEYQRMLKLFKTLAFIALLLSFLVIILGAYTRLTNAGLGCPDWPGCYGKLVLPAATKLNKAQTVFPDIPIELRKAWTEMIHRYAAGSLALIIFVLSLSIFLKSMESFKKLALVLLLLVIFQALLGMWTVTMKLLPLVVMSHLLGGMLLFAFLGCFLISFYSNLFMQEQFKGRVWIGLGILLVLLQISLGGWVSANYAGLACIGFPKCSGLWLPEFYFSEGFNLLQPVGKNYQGGLLENAVRMTIQMMHRLGAVITASYILILALSLWRHASCLVKKLAPLLAFLIVLQFILGILNVTYLLPLPIALAHNAVAALILNLMILIFYLSKRRSLNG